MIMSLTAKCTCGKSISGVCTGMTEGCRNMLPYLESPETAIRYNADKLQWNLVDFKSLEVMVRVLEFGAKKYSPDNWKKGTGTDKIFESLMRHLVAIQSGEENDPESGLPHTGHILCNAMFLAWMVENKPEFHNLK